MRLSPGFLRLCVVHIVLLCLVAGHIPHAYAIVSAQDASNAIGQTDADLSAPAAIYTKGTIHDAAHKLGYNAPIIGIALDVTDHRLFVVDTGNNRVLVYNMDVNNALSDRIPDYVLGQLNFYANTAATTQAGMNVPNGITFDDARNLLYVTHGTANRVTVYDVTTITNGEDAINVLGQTNFTTATAATTQAGMNVPQDATYDDTNKRLFVSQSTGNRVTVYNLAPGLDNNLNAKDVIGAYDSSLTDPQPIYTKGTAHNGPYKLGMSAPVIGIALDTVDHRLFIADTGNNRILVYNMDSNNALLDRIPDNVLGQTTFHANSATNTQTGLSTPNGLAYDSVGKRLFVAEGAGNRVKVYNTTSITDGENAVNVLGQTTFTTATAATTQAGMNVPQDVTYDETNKRLFVSQSTGNRVTVYDVTTIQNGENATNVLGQANFTATAAATTQAGMNVPYGLSYNNAGQILYVAQGTGNRVTTYDVASITDGENATKVLGQANFTATAAATTQAGMNAPRGITYDESTSFLYVAQTTGNRVTVYDVASITDGENATKVLGQANFTGTAAANTQAGMNSATGVAMDEVNDKLYVVQNGSSRTTVYDVATITDGENAVDALGQHDDSTSTPGPIYTKSAANNGPNAFGLSAPIIGVALDLTDHRLFVSDTGNNRVLVYNLNASNVLVNRIPDNVLGQTNYYSNAAATTQAGMNVPNGLAYDDPNNRLFVAQTTGNRVTVYDVAAITDGENATGVLGQANFTATAAATTQAGMNVPTDVTYDSTGQRLFVAQNTGNRVTVYDVATVTDGENATGVLGQANFTATAAATTQAGMNVPYGLALSGTTITTLFVSQGTGNRVTTYDVTAVTNGENAVKVLGQANFTGTAAATTQAGMSAPRGMTYDATNKRLYVSETTNNRVLAFDVADITDGENAIAVLGQAAFTTATANVTQEGLSNPNGVAIDVTNKTLYVVQSAGNRVSAIDLNAGFGNGENATGVLGQADYTSTAAATTQVGMNVPYGLAYNEAGQILYVSQGTGNRVTTYDVAVVTNGENAVAVLGQANFTATAAATTQAGMNAPRGITYDASATRLYVAQTTGNRVTVYDVASITNGENAVNVLGQANFTATAAANTQAGMNAATGVAMDETNDRLYVLQSGASRVTIYDLVATTDGENAVDALGQHDDSLSTPGPIYTKGTANNAPHKLGMSAPQAVELDATNNRLFVADSSNNRILVYNLNASHQLLDLIPDAVLGQAVYYTNAAATTQAGLSTPTGIAFDDNGNRLFVSDFTNNRIVLYDTASITDGENAVEVLGQVNYTTATAATTQLGLSGPRQLSYDENTGQLFVADTTNNRIVIFSVGMSGSSPASGGDSFHFIGF